MLMGRRKREGVVSIPQIRRQKGRLGEASQSRNESSEVCLLPTQMMMQSLNPNRLEGALRDNSGWPPRWRLKLKTLSIWLKDYQPETWRCTNMEKPCMCHVLIARQALP